MFSIAGFTSNGMSNNLIVPLDSSGLPSASSRSFDPPAKYISRNLFVCDLHPSVSEGDLRAIFAGKGLENVSLHPGNQGDSPNGHAKLVFENTEAAEHVLDTMNYHTSYRTKHKALRIMWNISDMSDLEKSKQNIFVSSLDKSVDSKDLHNEFKKFGYILSCKVMTDASDMSLGFGFVLYASLQQANAAISEGNNMDFHGREVHVGIRDPVFTTPRDFNDRLAVFSNRPSEVQAKRSIVASRNIDKTNDLAFEGYETPTSRSWGMIHQRH